MTFEGSVYVLELDTNEGTKLGLRDVIVLGTILGTMYGLDISTYDGSDL